jgi:hypothetical protein
MSKLSEFIQKRIFSRKNNTKRYQNILQSSGKKKRAKMLKIFRKAPEKRRHEEGESGRNKECSFIYYGLEYSSEVKARREKSENEKKQIYLGRAFSLGPPFWHSQAAANKMKVNDTI